MNTTRKIAKAMKDASKAKTSAYDTTAVVKRIEGNTAWVHIPGGVDETPVRMTINAKVGDSVQVRVSDGSAWLAGNASAPPTDDTTAFTAVNMAGAAKDEAESAHKAATEAWGYAEEAKSAAATAETHASEAKVSAQNASEYASRALGNLSTVQSVAETLTWITQHGTMALTSDVALDPTHVYFVQDAGGDYVVGGVTYAVVTEPDVADIATYYELTIDESLNNYVGTHLALTSEGLWLIPEVGGNKVLIATGGVGHTYEDAGTYIIDGSDNVLAQFLENGAQIGQNGGAHSVIDANGQRFYASNGTTQLANIGYGEGNSQSGTQNAPYYTFGKRLTTATPYSTTSTYAVGDLCTYDGSLYVCRLPINTPQAWTRTNWLLAIGNYSLAEGMDTLASGYYSHAEGIDTKTVGYFSHAEGNITIAGGGSAHSEGEETMALGVAAHSEGYQTIASGYDSHAQGVGTIANRLASTAIGLYNISEADGSDYTRGNYALIIGNGTSDNARSNALTVDWSGDVCLALDTTAASGTDHDLYAAITALGWQNDVIV